MNQLSSVRPWRALMSAQGSPSAAAEERSDEGTASAPHLLAAVGCNGHTTVFFIRMSSHRVHRDHGESVSPLCALCVLCG